MAIILDLDNTGTIPQTYTPGNWPRTAMDTGKWHVVWTPTNASSHSSWRPGSLTYWCLFGSNDTNGGGIWLEWNPGASTHTLMVSASSSGSPIATKVITWNAAQAIDLTIEQDVGNFTVANAASGNGSTSYTPESIFAGTTLGVGTWASGGFTLLASTFSDVDDTQAATPSVASWMPRGPYGVPRRAGALAALLAAACVAPVLPQPDPPPPPAPELVDVVYPDFVAARPRAVLGGGLGTGVFAPIVPTATTYNGVTSGGGSAGTVDRTVAFTPVVGDLLVAFVSVSTNTNANPRMTDDQGGQWHLVGTALWGTSANNMACFVRNALCTAAVAHTITAVTGTNDAAQIGVVAVKGMTRTGKEAVRSFGSQANQAASTTPAPALNQAASTFNITLTAVASSNTTTTPPSGWTERVETAQTTPTTAIEIATRDNGFTGTTITYGATKSVAYASMALELDGSAPQPDIAWDAEYPDMVRRAPPRPHGGLVAPPYETGSPPATPAPELSWAPQYPDILLPRARRLTGGAVAPPYDTSSPAATALSIGKAIISQRINALFPETGTFTTPATDIAVSSVANATDTFTSVGHGMVTGDGPYKLAVTGGSLPTGTDAVTRYWVIVTGADTFRVATSVQNAVAGTQVNLTSDGSGSISLVRHVDTQATGSAFLAFATRGQWDAATGAAPTDNKGNTYTAVAGPQAYANFPASKAAVYADLTGVGGAAHTWSLTWGNADEVTIGALEVVGATVCIASSMVETAIGSTTITSPTVDATAKALLIAVVFGNGPVGQDHTFTFLDDFIKIPECTAEGDISNNGYIQHSVAYKVVNTRGRYSFRVQGVNQEGGQLVLLALQATADEVPAMDWYVQAPPIIRRERRPMGGVVAPVTVPVATVTQWQPTYPDQVVREPRAPASSAVVPPADTTTVPLAWAPTYPSIVRGAAPRPHGGVSAPPIETLTAPLAWSPAYPDFARSAPPRLQGGAFAPPADTTTAPLCWAPTYADQARGPAPRPRGGESSPPADRTTGPLTWAPTFPSAIARAPRRELGLEVAPIAPVAAAPPAPDLWCAVYPDRVPGAAPRPISGAVAPVVVPAPAPPAPELAWEATYPDRIPLVVRHPLGGAIAPVFVPPPPAPAPELSWAPVYPDAIPPPRAALIVGGAVAPADVLPNAASPLPHDLVVVLDDPPWTVTVDDGKFTVVVDDPVWKVTVS